MHISYLLFHLRGLLFRGLTYLQQLFIFINFHLMFVCGGHSRRPGGCCHYKENILLFRHDKWSASLYLVSLGVVCLGVCSHSALLMEATHPKRSPFKNRTTVRVISEDTKRMRMSLMLFDCFTRFLYLMQLLQSNRSM